MPILPNPNGARFNRSAVGLGQHGATETFDRKGWERATFLQRKHESEKLMELANLKNLIVTDTDALEQARALATTPAQLELLDGTRMWCWYYHDDETDNLLDKMREHRVPFTPVFIHAKPPLKEAVPVMVIGFAPLGYTDGDLRHVSVDIELCDLEHYLDICPDEAHAYKKAILEKKRADTEANLQELADEADAFLREANPEIDWDAKIAAEEEAIDADHDAADAELAAAQEAEQQAAIDAAVFAEDAAADDKDLADRRLAGCKEKVRLLLQIADCAEQVRLLP